MLRIAVILALRTVQAAATGGTDVPGTVLLSYTIQQAEARQAVYTAGCVVCHGPLLAADPPPEPGQLMPFTAADLMSLPPNLGATRWVFAQP